MQTEELELLTKTGHGTPMGNLLRRFWIPALLSSELSAPNCDPVPVRLLGERLIAWRDENGRIGVFDEFCPHRCASLTLGRAEGDGLRCIYHGWKFAIDGTILETPNCARSGVREKLRATVFPSAEAGDIVWVYLGPKDKQPPLPDYAFMHQPAERRDVSRSILNVNWLQSLEGHLDSSHAGILHKDSYPFSKKTNPEYTGLFRDGTAPFTEDDTPVLKVEDTTFGFQVAAIRNAEQAGQPVKYARVHAFALPFMCVVPPRAHTFEVPIDDEHVSLVTVFWDPATPIDRDATRSAYGADGMYSWNPTRTVRRFQGDFGNRWYQDRSQMRAGASFSGVNGFLSEDFSVITSMGPIVDRRKEHLIEQDVAVVRMRRQLLKAATDLQKGIDPTIPTAEDTARIQAGDGVLQDGQSWQELVPGNQPARAAAANGQPT
jgi:phthalate 4,5-dioxygenase